MCCVRRRRKTRKNPPYTEEMRNALSASFCSLNTAGIQAYGPPVAYRTHSSTLQRLSVATHGALLGVDPRPRPRPIRPYRSPLQRPTPHVELGKATLLSGSPLKPRSRPARLPQPSLSRQSAGSRSLTPSPRTLDRFPVPSRATKLATGLHGLSNATFVCM